MIEQESYTTQSSVAEDKAFASGETGMMREEVSLIEVLTQLAKRKWLIAKVTGCTILAGAILAFALPVRYTAMTAIMPPQQTPSSAVLFMNQLTNSGASSGAGALAAAAGMGLGLGIKNPNDIFLGLLKSRPIADAIVRKFNLLEVYRSRDMTAARKKLENNTDIASEKSGFISVSVTDRDKKRAADIANEYTAQLRVLTKSIAVTEASQRRLFYEGQLKEAKEALIGAEMNFQQVQQSKGMVQLDAQAKAMIEGLTALRAKVAAKEVEVEALRSYSTDRNPELQLAESELSSLRAEVERLEQSSHSSGFTDLGMKDVPSAGLDYLSAQHEVLYRQTLFDLLIKQYDAAKLDESKEAAVIQVVEPAIEPDRRSAPKRLLILLLATVLGLFVGIFVGLFQWWSEIVNSDPESARQLMELHLAWTGRKPIEL